MLEREREEEERKRTRGGLGLGLVAAAPSSLTCLAWPQFTDCAPSRPPHFSYINTAARLDRARLPNPPFPPLRSLSSSFQLTHRRHNSPTSRREHQFDRHKPSSTSTSSHFNQSNHSHTHLPTKSTQDASQEDRRRLQAQGCPLAPFLPGLSRPLRLSCNRIRN